MPEAVADVAAAYAWYEEKDLGLGSEFLLSFESALDRICEYPEIYPIRFDSFRRILIARFPHAVYFECDENVVLVHCAFHCAQDPARLQRRLIDP